VELQRDLGVAYLFISHDLAVVQHVADRIAVMYLGRLMETAATGPLLAEPAHPYTQALLSAVPVPDPERERGRQRIVLTGEIADAQHPPSGCVFRTRCWRAEPACEQTVPELVERGVAHPVACLFPDLPDPDGAHPG